VGVGGRPTRQGGEGVGGIPTRQDRGRRARWQAAGVRRAVPRPWPSLALLNAVLTPQVHDHPALEDVIVPLNDAAVDGERRREVVAAVVGVVPRQAGVGRHHHGVVGRGPDLLEARHRRPQVRPHVGGAALHHAQQVGGRWRRRGCGRRLARRTRLLLLRLTRRVGAGARHGHGRPRRPSWSCCCCGGGGCLRSTRRGDAAGAPRPRCWACAAA
jgi:hypothetical protein